MMGIPTCGAGAGYGLESIWEIEERRSGRNYSRIDVFATSTRVYSAQEWARLVNLDSVVWTPGIRADALPKPTEGQQPRR